METIILKLALFIIFQTQIISGAPIIYTYNNIASFSVTTSHTFIDLSNETNVIRCSSNYDNVSLEWKYPSEWDVNVTENYDSIELSVFDTKNITENNIQCVGYYYYNETNFAYELVEVEIVSEVHYAQFKSSEKNQVDIPYESRVKVYCRDIKSNKTIISIDTSSSNRITVVDNSLIIGKHKDHYEFEIVDNTTVIFTVKYLTTDLNISCNSGKSNKQINIKGYNTVETNIAKYATNTTNDEDSYIYHPFGREVKLNSDYEMNVAVIYKNGTVDVVVDQLQFKKYYSNDFNFEKTILDDYVFTIKNLTKELNETKVVLFNDTGIIHRTIHVIGFEYEPLADPKCLSQTTEANAMLHSHLSEKMSHFFCVVKNSNASSEVSYHRHTNQPKSKQPTTDMTDKMVMMDSNEDAFLFQLSLSDNDNDHVVSCNVTQSLPGKYVNVKSSVCTSYN